ncbi:MAG: Chemotaxis protein CheY [Pseudomonadota bacterium]|jgi:two-component system chemotaxis response regulator CheY
MNILIVDDSKVMRMIVRRTLRQANIPAHVVEEAENGQDALQKLAGFRADLILSDWNMPTMDGPALLAAVRASGNHHVKFGFITSQSSVESRETAQQAGAVFLITKPFSAEDLEAAMGPVLRGR